MELAKDKTGGRAMKDIILKTEKLSKSYGKVKALDSADISVMSGDIYAMIGRNGAGKTTLMKTITGLTEASSGEYEIFGKKGKAAEAERNRIGCLIENPAFFGNMSAYDNLKYYCLQKGICDYKKIDEVLEAVGLLDTGSKKFKAFSLGMKQRLGIAFALLDNPDLVVLDEPINGLDPIGISELRDTFFRLNKEKGITMMISSHILSELYMVANRFMFIDGGRVIKEISKEELDRECSRCIVLKTDDIKRTASLFEANYGDSEYMVIDEGEMRIYDESLQISKINRMLVENGIDVNGIYDSGVSLEDYFKNLVS